MSRNRLIVGLERHAYAPELNKLHLRGGGTFNVPGVRTIGEARRVAFPKPVPRIVAHLVEVRKGGYMTSIGCGPVRDRRDGLLILRLYREKFPDRDLRLLFRLTS